MKIYRFVEEVSEWADCQPYYMVAAESETQAREYVCQQICDKHSDDVKNDKINFYMEDKRVEPWHPVYKEKCQNLLDYSLVSFHEKYRCSEEYEIKPGVLAHGW